MTRAYSPTGIFLSPGAAWNPDPTGGHHAALNPDPTRGQSNNPNPTGGHHAGWNPDPTRGGGRKNFGSGGQVEFDTATASPWPWRGFDASWTFGAGGDALLAQGLRKVRGRLIGEGDIRRDAATKGRVRKSKQAPDAIWRWGSEFRQQAVVCELLSRTLVNEQAVYAVQHNAPSARSGIGLHLLFEVRDWTAQSSSRQGFDHGFQIDKVVRAAVEREERLPEILTQAYDFRAYFYSLSGLDSVPLPHVDELISVSWAWATHVVMALKNNVAEVRPVMRSSVVVPVIPTPQHGSLPSGHATIAAMTANLLAELLYRGTGGRADVMRRLAARIAFNRVVAGVHFPMDSLAGCHLGRQLASYLSAMADGGRAPEEFSLKLDARSEWLEGDTSVLKPAPLSNAAASTSLGLQQLWKAAANELRQSRF